MKFKKNAEIGKITPKDEYPWVLRAKQVKKLIADYQTSFKNTTTWLEAVREKWDLDLFRYISAVATVQAQMIAGEKVGWSKADIFGIDYPLSDEELHLWLKRQKEQAERGYIDVAIPTTRIAEWKRDAGVDKAAA